MKKTPITPLEEIVRRYPDVPRLIILKADVQRRGVYYTDEAIALLDPARHQTSGTHIFGTRDGVIRLTPESLLLRDGSSIITTPTPLEENPYIVDVLDGAPWLFDDGHALEEVEYWPAPDFYSKTSSSGVLMKNIVSTRPQRLNIFPYRYCTFWNNGKGCAFCDIVAQMKKSGKELKIPARLDPVEVGEVIGEALKEPGRFSAVFLTSGSIVGGARPFDDEIDYYIAILNEVGKNFRTKKFPSQLIGTAFEKNQLQRLYDETGLMSYTANIEVLELTVTMKHPDAMAALLSGKSEITGHLTSPPFMFQELDDKRVRTVLNSYDVLGGPHTFNVITTTKTFHDNNPKTYAAVFAALEEAVAYINKNKRSAAEIYQKASKTKESLEDLIKEISQPSLSYTTTPLNISKFSDFMYKTGTIKTKPNSWKDLFFPNVHGKQGS